jgi:hypothetical protein
VDQDEKTPVGAPSDDTTSALFVSARKKQLQQQEAERIAKEREAERIAAEAEVRRLEVEVEERRRKAEEDARRAEAEAEQRRRQADENARRVEAEAEQRRRLADDNARRAEAEAEQRRRQADREARRASVEDRAKMQQAAQDPNNMMGAVMNGSGAIYNTKAKKPFKKILLFVGCGIAAVIVFLAVVIIYFAFNIDEDDNGHPVTPDPSASTDIASPSQAPDVRPSSPEAAGSYIDVTLTFFYLRGIDEADHVWFYSNGTMEIFYSSSGQTHTHDYTIDGDTISVHGSLYNNPPPFLFTIVSESLLIDQDGDHFIALDSGGGHTSEWTLDPFAHIQTSAMVELLMLEIPFPDSELYLRSISPDSITLSSMDDTASLSFQVLFEFDWLHTQEALIEVKDEFLVYMLNVLPGDVIVIDDGYFRDPNVYTYAYFELLYERDGEHRSMRFTVGGFITLPVGSNWYYAMGVDCLSEQFEEYKQLLENIGYEMMRLHWS